MPAALAFGRCQGEMVTRTLNRQGVVQIMQRHNAAYVCYNG